MTDSGGGDEDAPGPAGVRLMPQNRFEWERVVRRVVIPPEPDPRRRKSSPSPANVKYVVLTGATYADPDGSRVRPGAERLAAVTGLSVDVVRRCLRRAVALGLYDQIVAGHRQGRRAKASVYQLSIPEDLQERFELLPVDELPPETPGASACGKPVVRVEQRAPAPSDPAEHQAPAPTVPAPAVAVHRAPAPPDEANTGRQRLEHRAPAPPHQPIDQPPLRPDHSWRTSAVTPPTRETAALWTAKRDPGLAEHPARGVVRIPGSARGDAEHPGSADLPDPADATATVPLPLVPDPDPAARTRHLRLVHSGPTRRPA